MYSFNFQNKHIGPKETDLKEMFRVIEVKNLNQLIEETIPADIIRENFTLTKPKTEIDFITNLKKIAQQNKVFKNYIGQGFYDTHTPNIILRNIFENPSWYTAYTPYQAEISQGRMEALLNFQTIITDLTGLEIANASLLDESTACAEAMTMAKRISNKTDINNIKNNFFIDENLFEHNKQVLITRAEPLDINLIFGDYKTFKIDDTFFGGIIQYPNKLGEIVDIENWVKLLKSNNALSITATDLLALTIIKSPGELGVDIAVGNSQRFGVPLGFGGPHAAFFATKKDFIREMPGRIIGVSVDSMGNIAYRMTLQTREQHIKRDKATSNICTAQALLAIMASMYVCFHGKKGLKLIALSINHYTNELKKYLTQQGYDILTSNNFDTISIKTKQNITFSFDEIKAKALKYKINLHFNKEIISISLDETITIKDLLNLSKIFSNNDFKPQKFNEKKINIEIENKLLRNSDFLNHKIFNQFSSETELLRYIKFLENKDLSLANAMIPLGSCTMKLNATTQMVPLSWKEFSNIHPYAPQDQVKGYLTIINQLKDYLKEITNFDDISFQPNSGAQGEYAGLMAIRAYFKHNNQLNRNKILIPVSAHGTNPASAYMCGFEIIIIKCDENGNVDLIDFKEKVELNKNELAGLMITYPSTHGVYEEGIKNLCQIIHENGGLVYMDGANMNAQVGYTSPANIGADVCHLNLHKTFAIPHGGGGPGMGPIGVNNKLAPFLPKHFLQTENENKKTGSVSASPYGSALILLISYAYIELLGTEGVKKSTLYAILNANYIKDRIKNHFKPLYIGTKGRVAHELILDLREFKKSANIEAIDVAKRLIDFGFHPPTVAFPVVGTIMIEPTESEPKEELDRFCDALITIRKEIKEIEDGIYSQDDNVLKNSPHPIQSIVTEEWNKKYSREKAVYPNKNLKIKKFWPSISRINDTYGDRNLFCNCPSLEI